MSDSANRGNGAEINGQSLLVSPDFDEELFPLFLHCSRAHQRYRINLPYKQRSLGVAAYHLCLVAKNTAVLALESTVRLWDFAAAWLIIKEAGGLVKCFEGDRPFPTNPGSDYRDKPFPIIAALSPEVMKKAEEFITRK